MKRCYFCVLFALTILLCACETAKSNDKHGTHRLYFPSENASASDSALRTLALPDSLLTATPEEFLEIYLQTEPPSGGLPVLPEQWTLFSVHTEAATLTLTFSGTQTDALTQSLSLACMTKTLLQSDDLLRISFLLPGSTTPLVFSESDVLLEDTAMLPQEEMLVLYLPDDMQRYLRQESRTVEAMDAAEKPRRIMELLLDGQSNPYIPDGTTLLNIGVENGICTVDLSSEFAEKMQRSFYAERMAVFSIVNSLTELPTVSTVDFWVAGAPLDALSYLNLSTGVSRDTQLIASPPDSGVLDTTLYMTCGDSSLLVGVPARLSLSEELSKPELLFRALTQLQGQNGIKNCVPLGTQLLSVRLENGECILDLNAEFLDGCTSAEEERLAVCAVIATMSNLEDIHSVYILVEGLEPTYRDSFLQNLRQSQPEWFAS